MDGYTAYWEAVDRTVWYLDSIMLKKHDKFKKKKSFGFPDQKDQFKWQNPKYNWDFNIMSRGLPPPP